VGSVQAAPEGGAVLQVKVMPPFHAMHGKAVLADKLFITELGRAFIIASRGA